MSGDAKGFLGFLAAMAVLAAAVHGYPQTTTIDYNRQIRNAPTSSGGGNPNSWCAGCLSGSTSFDPPALTAFGTPTACATTLINIPGSIPGDYVVESIPSDLSTGITVRMLVQSTGYVQVALCNQMSTSYNPPVRIYGAAVIRMF